MTPELTMDAADPLVIVLTWVLTWAVGRWMPGLKNHRKVLPTVAVLIAVFIRAVMESTQGEPLTTQTILHGLSAGAITVMGHAQVRQFTKSRDTTEDGTDAGT